MNTNTLTTEHDDEIREMPDDLNASEFASIMYGIRWSKTTEQLDAVMRRVYTATGISTEFTFEEAQGTCEFFDRQNYATVFRSAWTRFCQLDGGYFA